MSGAWAAPGETVPQPAPPGPADPALQLGPTEQEPTRRPRSGDVRPPLPPPPLPLRPMTIPDVLDGAFGILKQRPRDVLILAAVFVVPIEVVSAILLRDVLDTGGLSAITDPTTTADDGNPFAGLDATLVSIAISAVSLALLAGALAHLVARWYDGADATPGEAALVALRRSPALVVGLVAVHLMELVGLLGLGVGAYVAMALAHVVSPVIVAERVGPFRAIGRSIRLTTGRFGASLAIPGLVGLIGALLGFGFQLLPEVITAVVPGDWDWLIRAAGQIVAQLVIAPFTAGVAVLYHLDLRIRTEGLDIEHRMRARFGG